MHGYRDNNHLHKSNKALREQRAVNHPNNRIHCRL